LRLRGCLSPPPRFEAFAPETTRNSSPPPHFVPQSPTLPAFFVIDQMVFFFFFFLSPPKSGGGLVEQLMTYSPLMGTFLPSHPRTSFLGTITATSLLLSCMVRQKTYLSVLSHILAAGPPIPGVLQACADPSPFAFFLPPVDFCTPSPVPLNVHRCPPFTPALWLTPSLPLPATPLSFSFFFVYDGHSQRLQFHGVLPSAPSSDLSTHTLHVFPVSFPRWLFRH